MLSSPRNQSTMYTVSSRLRGVIPQGSSTRFPTTPSNDSNVSIPGKLEEKFNWN